MKAPAGRRVLMLLENNSFQNDKRPMNEAGSLVRAGYDVAVICPKPPGGQSYTVVDGVHLYQFRSPPVVSGFLGYVAEFAYATSVMSWLSLVVLARQGFDILHVHNPPDTFFLLAAFYKLLGKRVVYDHHDLAPEVYAARFAERSNPLLYQTLVLFEQLTCRVAHLVITTNASYQALERQRDGVSAERSVIVRNGPVLDGSPSIMPDADLRRRAGTILGYVGHMGPQDGLDYLLRALSHLVRDLGKTDFLCVLVGAGDALSALRTLASQLNLADHVFFTGWVAPSEVARYLSSADICVTPDPSNPYNDRSTMIKIMEYMALSKPVVAFDLPEHRVTAQGAALYARPNDELDFARQIAALMDNPEQRRQLGQCGRERIETELAWPYQEKRLLEAYAALYRSSKVPELDQLVSRAP